MAKRKGRRARIKNAADAQRQLREIENAQKAAKQGKMRLVIDSVEKSRQRLLNSLRRIKDANDAHDEFE